jgi:hypothetical protein
VTVDRKAKVWEWWRESRSDSKRLIVAVCWLTRNRRQRGATRWVVLCLLVGAIRHESRNCFLLQLRQDLTADLLYCFYHCLRCVPCILYGHRRGLEAVGANKAKSRLHHNGPPRLSPVTQHTLALKVARSFLAIQPLAPHYLLRSLYANLNATVERVQWELRASLTRAFRARHGRS